MPLQNLEEKGRRGRPLGRILEEAGAKVTRKTCQEKIKKYCSQMDRAFSDVVTRD